MIRRKDFAIQDIIFIILLLSYLLFSYLSKQLIISYYENSNVVLGLSILKFVLSAVLAFILSYTYKDLLAVHWRKFQSRSWVKYLWIVLAWIGIILILNLTRSFSKVLFGYPFIHNWNPMSFRNKFGDTIMISGWSALFIALNQLIIPIAKEIVFRHILFLKHAPKYAQMVTYSIIGSLIFGLGFYHVDETLVGCLPYILCNIVFLVLYYQTRNIWYPIFTHILIILVMLPLEAYDSFLLPYCS